MHYCRKNPGRLIACTLLIIVLSGCGQDTSQSDSAVHIGISGEPISDICTEENPSPAASSDPSAAAGRETPGVPSPDGAFGDSSGSTTVNPPVTSDDAQDPQPTPAPTAPPTITLTMVGDILLHTPVEKSALREDGTYSYDAIFANTKDLISRADLALVNQEVILGGKELGISGYPAFNAPYELGDDLTEAGFDVICHGTNHALDKGRQGLTNCLTFWETNYPDIQVLGIHDTPDEPLYIYEKDGMRIAFLNYTYSTNGIPLPEGMPYAVDMLTNANKEKIIRDIQMAESQADFTVICPHWGTEYRLTPDASQEKWTKLFLENGVDLVLGTHPHVIEPIELLTDETTGHSMLVYYSLGNFVNWTSSQGDGIANRMVGGMARITLSRDEAGSVVISDYGIKALVCHLTSGTDGVTVVPLSDYTPEKAAENAICRQDPAFSYEYCLNLCDQVWGELWE